MKVEDIQDPSFIKALDEEQLNTLSSDIRDFLLKSISKTGGHLSSNLGIVELTIALHYVFNSPKDKIFFDVGHQAYIHKILTGRAKDFKNLKKLDGLSGFQKRCESEHDVWEAGHSSTALSAAVGMAIARDLNHENYNVLPVIGDASIASGESFEALNHLGSLNNKVIVILNDNQMAIGKSVGGFNNLLSNIRLSNTYNNFKTDYKKALTKGKLGKAVYKGTKVIKDFFKNGFINDTIFEDFGLDYLGPVNGHDIKELIRVLELAKHNDKSVVVHIITQKGKGYEHALDDQEGKWHSTKPFDIETGKQQSSITDKTSFSKVVSNQVEKHMSKDEDIVVVTPAMIDGSALRDIFNKYPKRSFDVGIAEEHALTFGAALSLSYKKPFISVYSSFLQRAYDQINHDICRMNLPCLIAIDRAGIVGQDGPTHNGVFDIGLLTGIPNMILFSGKDAKETKQFINTAFKDFTHPYAFRIPREDIKDEDVSLDDVLQIGIWQQAYQPDQVDLVVITYGTNVDRVIDKIDGLNIEVINARFIKPMDNKMLDIIALKGKPILIYETDLMINSLGNHIASYFASKHYHNDLYFMGIDDHYSCQGTKDEVLEKEKLDLDSFIIKCKEILDEKGKN